MIEPISFTITTCNRLDLLAQTLDSFFKLNKYPIDEFIMCDDSGDDNVYSNLVSLYGDRFKIIQNKPKLGLAKSIDKLFSEAKNEYIFHCEDDWFFSGNPNFISDSLKILNEDKSIHQVWVRHQFDLEIQLKEYKNLEGNEKYKLIPIVGQWNGYSYNPGLRRKSDYKNFFTNGVAEIGDELNCAIHSAKFNYKSVLLNNTACHHIGYNRHTQNFIH